MRRAANASVSMDFDERGRYIKPTVRQWRSNRAAVVPWAPETVHWSTYRISLRQMLDGNGLGCDFNLPSESGPRDLKIKALPWVPIAGAPI